MHTDFSPYAKLSYIEDVQAVRVQWFKLHMSLEQFQTICGAAIEILGQNNGDTWIADQFESEGAFPQEIQDMISGPLVQMAKEAGIKKIVTITPKKKGLASLSTKKWSNNAVVQGNFAMAEYETMEDAMNWLHSAEVAAIS